MFLYYFRHIYFLLSEIYYLFIIQVNCTHYLTPVFIYLYSYIFALREYFFCCKDKYFIIKSPLTVDTR